MNRRAALAALASLTVGVLALSGCAGDAAPVESSQPPSAVATEFSPPEPTKTEAETAAEKPDLCAGIKGVEGVHGYPEDRVGGYIQYEMRDIGSIEYATGETVVDDEGQPAAYIVAEGDALHGIADRFCTEAFYVEMLNSIRRTSSYTGTPGFSGVFQLYPGDTINLNRFTIATVGDENGVVYDYTLDIPIPPQQ
ncbi:MAG: hypothetical protein ACTHXV_09350 [Canibacter sp.]